MKRRQYLIAGGFFALALLFIVSGVFRIMALYNQYRTDMLAYESYHVNSIVGIAARGMTGMVASYSYQLDPMLDRVEFEMAEKSFLTTGSTEELRRLMNRPDILQIGIQCKLAVLDTEGSLIAASDWLFPLNAGMDTEIGQNMALRSGPNGGYWLVFFLDTEGGLRYELAVSIQSLFSSQAISARIGRYGYLFLMDRDGEFFSFSSNGQPATYSMTSARNLFPSMEDEPLAELSAVRMTEPTYYHLYDYPWGNLEGAVGKDTTQTMVVTHPVTVGNTSFVMGAAISLQEFGSILTGTLNRAVSVVVLEIAGAIVLISMIAWMLIRNRRNSMEMTVLKERADLMEEINRQQQSLAHNERLQQLGIMTSGMAHEFNNLMTPIMGQSHLLLEQLADQEETPQFESALDIFEASEKARDIIKGMSSMSKKDVDMRFRTLEVGKLLRKTMNLAAMAKDPHAQETLLLPEEPMFVSGNEQLLTQAFLNLFINGYQASGAEGMLTVTVAREHRSGEEYVRVDVKDNGPGIPENKLSQIYEPFFTTKGERGTGLGLMICQKTIETHKGTINAANAPEGGAVFTIRLPLHELPEE